MQPRPILFSLVVAASLMLAACSSATSAPPTQAPATQAPAATTAPTVAPTAAPTAVPGLLDAIQKRGYMLISNDPAYAPQSSLKKNAQRVAGTKCPADALTTGEMEGFDVDVAAAVSKALGVEACFLTPDWNVITAGNWGDK